MDSIVRATPPAHPADPGDAPPGTLRARLRHTRAHTETLAAPLGPEDQCIQSMPDASPTKWHRAHTSWFFEQFVLKPHAPAYRIFDPRWDYLHNSYYETLGARQPRPFRGLVTRPTAEEVGAYRAHVDAALDRLLETPAPPGLAALVELGIQHEQQHQELLVTDILHAFAASPLAPAALPAWREPAPAPGPTRRIAIAPGIAPLGAPADGFAFDNERPRHDTLLHPAHVASRLVRNADYAAFIDAGGYQTPTLWMAEGWDLARAEAWDAPLHWRTTPDGTRRQFTPAGLAPLDPDAPVRHVSWYEADAFARWAGARLPTEAELETAAPALDEFTGHAWQWTASAHRPYPGFTPPEGAIGEYNGKFMINTMVLRGSSAATPPGHTRPTYRNFFHPDKRWQFTGLRLAWD